MSFTGVLTALVTPLGEGGREVDLVALGELCERQIAAGVHGLIPCGTTGESPTLSHAEQVAVVRKVVAVARKRVPVLAGAGSSSTAHAVELAKAAREVGADGVLAVTPYYNRPTQAGLDAHFRAIAREGELPVVLYNVPGRTGVDLLPATVAALAREPGIVAIKEATGSIGRAQQILQAAPGFTVLSGDDVTMMALWAVGAQGVISVLSNPAPRETVTLWDHVQAGRWAEARALNLRLQPLCDALFVESNPIPVKFAMSLLGQARLEYRLPLTHPSARVQDQLGDALKGLGLL